jgi:hypothetical protein
MSPSGHRVNHTVGCSKTIIPHLAEVVLQVSPPANGRTAASYDSCGQYLYCRITEKPNAMAGLAPQWAIWRALRGDRNSRGRGTFEVTRRILLPPLNTKVQGVSGLLSPSNLMNPRFNWRIHLLPERRRRPGSTCRSIRRRGRCCRRP